MTAQRVVEQYYTKPVQWLIDNDIAGSTSRGCFAPDYPATRGETAVYLWRLQGHPEAPKHPFGDIADETQDAAVSWLRHTGISTGTDATTFSPDSEVTRAQLAALLHRLAGEPSAASHPFTDVATGWQQQPVAWMVAEGITTGTGPTTFAPNDPVTRAQLATFLYRYRGSPEVTLTNQSETCDIFIAVDSGGNHSCGLRTDQTIACWGNNEYNKAVAPQGRFTAVSAGDNHTCALRTDGAITCWGGRPWVTKAQVPSESFTAVSAGSHHACGLTAQDSITCWGYNEHGRTNAPRGRFVAVSAGFDHSCALTSAAAVTCWGDNEHDQTDAPAGRFTAVSAGNYHSCGLRADASVACWGENGLGQAKAPSGKFSSVSAGTWRSCGVRIDGAATCWGDLAGGHPRDLQGEFSAISTGGDHSCALTIDGKVTCWGTDWSARLRAPSGRFKAIGAGSEHSCAIGTDGALVCWGSGRAADGYDPFDTFETVSAGGSHSCTLRTDGTVVCWGVNCCGETDAPDGRFARISAGFVHSCGLGADATVTCWGHNEQGQTDVPEGRFTDVTAGSEHTCAIRSDSTVACWGASWGGQTNAPEGQFTGVSAGDWHTCGIRRDSTVACWGASWGGQTDAPEGQFISVSAGSEHTCAIRSDSTVACWGRADQGQTPTGSFTAISAGDWHTCGIRRRGDISCWGEWIRPAPPGVAHSVEVRRADPAECRPLGVLGVTAGFPLPDGIVRAEGTLRVAVLFVDFPNAEAAHTTEQEAELGLPYAESYLEASSYGQLDVEFVPLHRWLRADHDYQHYRLKPDSDDDGSIGFAVSEEAVRLADPDFDFAGIDSLAVVLPRSHFNGGLAGWSIETDEGVLAQQTINNNQPLSESREPFFWGNVAAHELVHNLGLLDMYPYGTVEAPPDAPLGREWVRTEIGLMGLKVYFPAGTNDPDLEAVWVFPDGYQSYSPVAYLESREMLAWSRWQLGWLDETQISCVTETEATVELGPVADPAGNKAMAAIPLSGTEVIVMESRRRTGYDAPREQRFPDGTVVTLPYLKTEGVLVYTVDASIGSGRLPIRIAGDPGNGRVDDYPLLGVGDSVTVRGYTINVESDNDNTHTVSIVKSTE